MHIDTEKRTDKTELIKIGLGDTVKENIDQTTSRVEYNIDMLSQQQNMWYKNVQNYSHRVRH